MVKVWANHGFIQWSKNVPIFPFVLLYIIYIYVYNVPLFPFVSLPNNLIVSFVTLEVFLTAAECQAGIFLNLSILIPRSSSWLLIDN